MATEFTIGEPLEWRHRDGGPDTQVTIRPVTFYGLADKSDTATIGFGILADGSGRPNLFTAPMGELARPQPREVPDYLRPPRASTTPPRISVETRREELRQAHAEAAKALAAVRAAEELAKRAKAELSNAQFELSRLSNDDATAAGAVTQALRNNIAPPCGEDVGRSIVSRARTERKIDQLGKARATFNRELRAAQGQYDQSRSRVRAAATRVMAAIIEAEVGELIALDQQAQRQRSRLRAALEWWPGPGGPVPVAPDIARYVVDDLVDHEPVGPMERQRFVEARQKPFVELFEKLLDNAEVNLL